ncbi:ATP-binding protein [Zhongshania aliphaticivorans]|nr:ATP-binding protein [Zhongshania aliphaticivorans]
MLTISKKLNIAFVGLALATLVATLGLARWSFNQGFLNYVNAQEQARLRQAQTALAATYQSSGNSWSGINNRQLGMLILQSAMNGHPEALGNSAAPPPTGFSSRPPPPRHEFEEASPVRSLMPSGAPTALYDNDNKLIAGLKLSDDSTRLMRFPIMVEGKRVGELRSEPRTEFQSPSETAFSQQQLITSWLIGVLCLLVAIGISLFLSRHFLTPIKRMFENVQKLSNGDYSMRTVNSGTDELAQLGRNINHLGQTLSESQHTRQRLFADISHELRTPLTILSGEIEALKDGVRDFNTEQLLSLDQEVQRLHHLVNDLYQLSVSDLGGLKYEFTNTNLNDVISRCCGSFQHQATEKGIQLSEQLSHVELLSDPQRLQQLFSNLLTNAIAYTDAPGSILVNLVETGGNAKINIVDSAPSVTNDQCQRLFDPLFRTDSSRSRRSGGAGLGLAICRNIVKAHGGHISACPSNTGGIDIEITLPINREIHS